MYAESDFLQLSGLQHLSFCERQCALIYIDQIWNENFFTASGRVLHTIAHNGKTDSRKNIKIARSLKISSKYLGVIGETDIVEFHKNGTILPVEFKRGRPKIDFCDKVQLCAQAICLEEQFNCKINEGAIFYFEIQHRIKVEISNTLRVLTKDYADRFHQLVQKGELPKAKYNPQCKSCSFFEYCMPKIQKKDGQVDEYLLKSIN